MLASTPAPYPRVIDPQDPLRTFDALVDWIHDEIIPVGLAPLRLPSWNPQSVRIPDSVWLGRLRSATHWRDLFPEWSTQMRFVLLSGPLGDLP